MKHLLIILSAIFIFSCGKDDDTPAPKKEIAFDSTIVDTLKYAPVFKVGKITCYIDGVYFESTNSVITPKFSNDSLSFYGDKPRPDTNVNRIIITIKDPTKLFSGFYDVSRYPSTAGEIVYSFKTSSMSNVYPYTSSNKYFKYSTISITENTSTYIKGYFWGTVYNPGKTEIRISSGTFYLNK